MNTEPIKSNPTLFYESVEREKPIGKLFVKWCWPAFFFPTLWLAYRKQYLSAFLYFIFLSIYLEFFIHVVSQATKYIPFLSESLLWFFIRIIPHLLLGTFGVSIYFKKWQVKKVPHYENESLWGIFLVLIFIAILNFITEYFFEFNLKVF